MIKNIFDNFLNLDLFNLYDLNVAFITQKCGIWTYQNSTHKIMGYLIKRALKT